ncbi:MAG: hypothetical protein KDA87_27665, partial [Planctomycetales bacterium]|nr:hypothetical protein [Planctomycetales bacterium]
MIETATGDFDANDRRDISDLEMLVAEASTPSGNSRPFNWLPEAMFDINGDTVVNRWDTEDWVRNVANTYLGDANLDGEFNSSDLVQVYAAGEFEDGVWRNSTWSTGDWNSDRQFDSADLVAAFQDGGYERGPRALAVPEPNLAGISMCLIISIVS